MPLTAQMNLMPEYKAAQVESLVRLILFGAPNLRPDLLQIQGTTVHPKSSNRLDAFGLGRNYALRRDCIGVVGHRCQPKLRRTATVKAIN